MFDLRGRERGRRRRCDRRNRRIPRIGKEPDAAGDTDPHNRCCNTFNHDVLAVVKVIKSPRIIRPVPVPVWQETQEAARRCPPPKHRNCRMCGNIGATAETQYYCFLIKPFGRT